MVVDGDLFEPLSKPHKAHRLIDVVGRRFVGASGNNQFT